MSDEHRFNGVSKHGRARFWHYSAWRAGRRRTNAGKEESHIVTYRQPQGSLGTDQYFHSAEFCLASGGSTASVGRSVDWKRRSQPMAWAPLQHTFDSLLLSAGSGRVRRRTRAVECFVVPAVQRHPMAWGQIASIEDWHPERFAWRLDIVPNADTISCDPCATLYARRQRTDPADPCATSLLTRRSSAVACRACYSLDPIGTRGRFDCHAHDALDSMQGQANGRRSGTVTPTEETIVQAMRCGTHILEFSTWTGQCIDDVRCMA